MVYERAGATRIAAAEDTEREPLGEPKVRGRVSELKGTDDVDCRCGAI